MIRMIRMVIRLSRRWFLKVGTDQHDCHRVSGWDGLCHFKMVVTLKMTYSGAPVISIPSKTLKSHLGISFVQ